MDNDPFKSGRNPDGTFAAGNRANPKGRPQGCRNKASLLLGELIDNEGDTSAGRALLDRLVAPRKDRPCQFELPSLVVAADAPKALSSIASAVAAGDLTASEASDLSRLVSDFVKAIEVTDHENRIAALEERKSS